MARRNNIPQGSWLLAEELLESGDPGFLDELCSISDADRLGSFAVTWYKDQRSASRQLLLQYIDRPLATYRHEPLVKRLLKNASANNDDEVMAHFMVAFDRTIRRAKKTRHRYVWSTRESWTEETIRVPSGTAMPKSPNALRRDPRTGNILAAWNQEAHDRLQLFSVATRSYLRRRCWRYFRTIGQQDPRRYVQSVAKALALYTDDDCRDGLALIDNWSLLHILFHHSEVLEARTRGWTLAEGQSLSNLKPAPAFPEAWKNEAAVMVELLGNARCRPVRQWTITMLKQHHPDALSAVPLETLLKWVCSDDEALADLAVESLDRVASRSQISSDGWLRLTEEANAQVLGAICELMDRHLNAADLTLTEIVQLACARPVPVAKLGLKWLDTRTLNSPDDCRVILRVSEAQAETVRRELVDLVRQKIASSEHFQPAWVLELLDSPLEDVREAGWQWLIEDDRAAHDVTIWQRLMETPYDNIHLRLVKLLEAEATRPDQSHIIPSKKLDDKLVRHLWASVLLNINRGGRQKPGVVSGIVDRLNREPAEASELLPILSVALRSVRTVEWRAALVGVVQLVETRPELAGVVRETFPELSIA